MKIKTTVRNYQIHIRMAFIKKKKINVGEVVEKI